MGGASSKPKGSKVSSFTTSVIPQPSRSVEFEREWQEVMKVLHFIPLPIRESIIMFYLIDYVPNFLTISPGSYKFSMSQDTLFKASPRYSDSAMLALSAANCRLKVVKEILEANHDPFLLTTPIECVDHRGPGHIPCETPLVQAICLGNVVLAEILGHAVKERCEEGEHAKQINRAIQVREEENKKKAEVDKHDQAAADKIWGILDRADPHYLQHNPELKIAVNQFENQLRKPGSESIIKSVLSHIKKSYIRHNFGSYHEGIARDLLVLTLKMRLSVFDLQILFSQDPNLSINQFQPIHIDKKYFLDRQRKIDVLPFLEHASINHIILYARLVPTLYQGKEILISEYLDIEKRCLAADSNSVPGCRVNRR